MLKHFTALGCLCWMAVDPSFAQDVTLGDLKKSFGNYEVSCQEMTLTRSLVKDEIYSKLEVLDFDKSGCEVFLSPTSINSIIEPVLNEMVFSNADHSQEPVVDANKVSQLEHERFTKAGKAVKKNARHLADACLSSAVGREKNETLLCYFGGPRLTSSAAYQTMFKAMLENSLPDLEPVCSTEPLTHKSASNQLFNGILSGRSSMTWDQLQATLQSDGFACAEDTCIRNVMGLIVPGTAKLRDELQLTPKSFFLLMPRYLKVYRGDWHPIGPSYNGCFVDREGKKTGHFCDGPSNGIPSGICLAKEDFHTWYGFGYMLNYASSDLYHAPK